MALDGLTLRERRGEADRGLPAAAAAPLRCRLDGDAGEPGRQDVLVAPLSAVHVEIVKNQAVRAAVVVRPPTRAAGNYGKSLLDLQRFEEAKSVLRKTTRVARRVLGDNHDITLKIRWNYAKGLYKNSAATLDDLREAVNTLEDAGRTARQVLGGAHPLTEGIEGDRRWSSRAIQVLTAAMRK